MLIAFSRSRWRASCTRPSETLKSTIIDYGSTDSSKEIAAHYAEKDPRVCVHQHPHCGLGEARNAACSLARGRYIAMMDADDVALPERLQLEVGFMEKHPRVGLLGGAVQWINAAGRSVYIGRVPRFVAICRHAAEPDHAGSRCYLRARPADGSLVYQRRRAGGVHPGSANPGPPPQRCRHGWSMGPAKHRIRW